MERKVERKEKKFLSRLEKRDELRTSAYQKLKTQLYELEARIAQLKKKKSNQGDLKSINEIRQIDLLSARAQILRKKAEFIEAQAGYDGLKRRKIENLSYRRTKAANKK